MKKIILIFLTSSMLLSVLIFFSKKESLISYSPINNNSYDTVMIAEETLEIRNKTGSLTVSAGNELLRIYSWEGASRSLTMLPRHKQWFGSKGIYYPGPGEHWEDHNGVSRAVVEEGVLSFDDISEFKKWLKHEYQSYLDYVFLDDGRIGGWYIVRERKQLDCSVWKVNIAGESLSHAIWEKSQQREKVITRETKKVL